MYQLLSYPLTLCHYLRLEPIDLQQTTEFFVKSNASIISIIPLAITLYITGGNAVAASKPGGRPANVVVVEVVEKVLAPTIQVPGTLASRQEAEIPAEVSGKLLWVAEVGTRVKSGDPVARLDDTLHKLRNLENSASLRREKSRLSFLEKDLGRVKQLAKASLAAKSQLEKLQMDYDVAATEVSLMQAKISVDKETLSRHVVRAPFDGVVALRSRREGEWINSGQTVVTVSNPNSLEIVARVSEKSVKNISVGLQLVIEANGQQRLSRVKALVPVGDSTSHLYDIRLNIEEKGWLAGETVRVSVPIGMPRLVYAVPRDALVMRRTGISIFRISDENKAERISVQTGIASGNLIEVIGDLKAGDKVVTRGSERLRPGQDVKTNLTKPEAG